MTEKLLTLVVPAYNEEEALGLFMPELIDACNQNNWNLIIVNDGSRDNILKILEKYNNYDFFKYITHKVNRGYGGALKTGFLNAETEFVITVDSDGQHRIEDIKKMKDYILESDADMVVGRRQGDASNFRAVGKSIIRFFAKLMMPLKIYDLNSGMKIYRTELVKKYLHLCPDSMAFSDIITLVFVSNRHLVFEKPIVVNVRQHGKSTINVKTAINTVYEILNIVLLFNPMKFFLPVGLALVFLGVAWGVSIAIMNRTVSVGASLSISLGLIIMVFGLLVEQIAQIRKNQFFNNFSKK